MSNCSVSRFAGWGAEGNARRRAEIDISSRLTSALTAHLITLSLRSSAWRLAARASSI